MTTNQRIHNAWQKSGLSVPDYADALGVSVHTLRAWFKPMGNASHRNAPEIWAREAERLGEKK